MERCHELLAFHWREKSAERDHFFSVITYTQRAHNARINQNKTKIGLIASTSSFKWFIQEDFLSYGIWELDDYDKWCNSPTYYLISFC